MTSGVQRSEARNAIIVRYGADACIGATELMWAVGAGYELRGDMHVGIKPNLVVAKPCSTGATTSPDVVAGIVEFLRECGVGRITVMEGSWAGESTKKSWRVCGYEKLAERYGLRLLDLKEDRTRSVTCDGFSFEVCASPLEVDYLINVPVLKGHCQTLMTCALKNLKGCLPDREKRRFHQEGLHLPIALLNTVLRPNVILVDALCGDVSFEEGGNPIPTNRLIAGRDPVCVDAYGASLMGIPLSEVRHIGLAERLGVGTTDVGKVAEIGHDASKAEVRALPPAVRHLASLVEERSACSVCYASLIHALYRTGGRKRSAGKIKIGQGFRGETGPGVGVGECAAGFDCAVRGCPPKAEDIVRVLAG